MCVRAVVSSSLDYICMCVGLNSTLTRNSNNFVSFSLQLFIISIVCLSSHAFVLLNARLCAFIFMYMSCHPNSK